MNRRTFLRSTAAFAAAALLPTWLGRREPHKINLQAFCANDDGFASRFGHMDSPFVQDNGGMWKYATDAKCIIRVPAVGEFPADEAKRLPAAGNLCWHHDQQRGWKPWPRQDWIKAASWNYDEYHVQAVGETYIDAKYDRLLRRELGDFEFCVIDGIVQPNMKAKQLLIRFDGGDGILCVLDKATTEQRIKEAR